MIGVPVYRRTGSALHAARTGVGIAYCGALALPVFLFESPLVLAFSLVALLAVGRRAHVGAELARAAALAVPLALLVVAINPLVSQQGLTVLVDGPIVPVLGNVDVTLEALVYGAVAGLRVLVVIARVRAVLGLRGPGPCAAAGRKGGPPFGTHRVARDARGAAARSRRPPAGRGLHVARRRAAGGADAGPRGACRDADPRAWRGRAGALGGARGVARGEGLRGARPVPGRPLRLVAPRSLFRARRGHARAALRTARARAGLGAFDPYPLLHLAAAPADVAFAAALPLVALAPFGRRRRPRA